MWIRLMLLSLLSFPATGAADDFKMIKLEQDVRNLERQVSELSRQIAVLQRREPETPLPGNGATQKAAEPADDPAWYNPQNWDRVRTGMNELEVIHLLGKPTTMRSNDAESRTLLYAVEIGSSGFLGGSVDLRNHQVVAVSKPVLK